jgi:peroxiredoxin
VLQDLDSRSERVFQVRRRVLEETRRASAEERATALDRAMEPFALEEEEARLEVALTEETDPVVRQALLLGYVSVETDLDTKDAALGFEALEAIGTEGQLWGLHTALVLRALDLAARADSAEATEWAQALVQQHPDAEVRAYALLQRLEAADRVGNEEAAEAYYTRLQDAAYAETQPGLIAAALFARYAPDGAVAVGARVPDFSLPRLDGEGMVSREDLLGRVYLLDFWAVWCLPCIDEMPTLHDAYERFHDEGFEIVSLSFDDSPDEVRAFRATQFPMPWLNAHVTDGLGGDLAERFGVRGLPKPILVGPEGRILALSSDELRGVFLERTLEQIYEAGD